METALNEYSSRTEAIEKKLKELDKTQDNIVLLEKELKPSKNENRLLKEQLLQTETYSRRNNLIFEGIKEDGKDTVVELYAFLIAILGFSKEECNRLLIVNCHRLGKRAGSTQPRPLIARFVLDSDRSRIWFKKSLLKNTPFIIRKDFPNEIVNMRKFMYPLFKEAQKMTKTQNFFFFIFLFLFVIYMFMHKNKVYNGGI